MAANRRRAMRLLREVVNEHHMRGMIEGEGGQEELVESETDRQEGLLVCHIQARRYMRFTRTTKRSPMMGRSRTSRLAQERGHRAARALAQHTAEVGRIKSNFAGQGSTILRAPASG